MSDATATRPEDQSEPDGLAEVFSAGWSLYEIAGSDDPHARWRALRERHPVLDAGDGVFFVSSWSLVDEVLRDSRHGAGIGVSASFDARDGLAPEVMGAWLMSLDGTEQRRARGLVRRAFTPRAITELVPTLREVTDTLVAHIEADAGEAPVDLVEDLAFALPSEVIRRLFGIPENEWAEEIVSVIRAVDGSPGSSVGMIEGLAGFFDRRLREDRVPPGLLAELQTPDPALGRLSQLEVVANAVLLVTAAIDTTAGLIGNAIHCLLERPTLLDAIQRSPDRIPDLVEETLRFEPPALSCSRQAGLDFELGGVRVPAGAHLLLGLAAANRDPSRYPDPDRFDLDRDFRGLLSFGGGTHHCLGATLARIEARLAIERLFVESPLRLEAIEPPSWQRSNPTVRALERLPVRRV